MKPHATLLMKKGAMLLVLPAMMWSCAYDAPAEPAAGQTSITMLPSAARDFVTSYCPDAKPLRADTEGTHPLARYGIFLSNGYRIEFDGSGEWLLVDAPVGSVLPAGIAPAPIADFVASADPDYGINEITRQPDGYTVGMVNGVDILFDTEGRFVRYTS